MDKKDVEKEKLKAVLVNYNYNPEWLKDYNFDCTIYDRSETNDYLPYLPGTIIKTKNIGNVDYDKLGYLVEHYDHLPEVFLWGKTNLFKFITKEEFDVVKDNKTFTPLLTKNHRTYSDRNGPVCFYDVNGMYWERNDTWYLQEHYAKVRSWAEWAREFGLPNPVYLPFPPGGNFILTREKVHKYSRDLYAKMRDTMAYDQLPGEAQLAERSYYLLWS